MEDRFSRDDYAREETYGRTRAPVDLASTLIPEAYRSATFFEVERRRLFARSWTAVGFASRLRRAGDVITGEVAGQPMIVTRDGDGAVRGFFNVCRHRGAKLVTTDCRVRRIRCPYHSWTYGLDGTLLGAPLFEGSGIPEDQQALFDTSGATAFDRADYPLLPVRAETWGPLVFVNLDAGAAPLATWLGDLPDRLAGYRLDRAEIVAGATYDIRANWKLIAENFMEYYHLPWVHPELVKVSRVEDHYRFQGHGMYTGMTTSPVTRDGSSGWSNLPPVPGLAGADAVSGRFCWIFPNAAVAVLPNHVFVLIAHPRGADRTAETTALALPGETVADDPHDSAIEQLAAFWDHVNREDIAIVERVQEGLAVTAYEGGRMCYRFEEPLHRFQNMVIDRMVGVDRVPEGDGDGPLVGQAAPAGSPVPARQSRGGSSSATGTAKPGSSGEVRVAPRS